MKSLWQRFIAALTPGVSALLILLAVIYAAAIAGKLTRTLDLYRWLATNAPDVWHGQLWRIVTYALLPMGIMDFVMNALALVMLGSMLERHWTRGELWRFCAIAAGGAGLAATLLAGPQPLTGAAPMMFGLLIAWMFVSGHEIVFFPILGPISVRQMVLIFAAASLLLMFFSAGLALTLIMAAGGLTGWVYLWLCHKWLMTRASRAVHSERINRLEL